MIKNLLVALALVTFASGSALAGYPADEIDSDDGVTYISEGTMIVNPVFMTDDFPADEIDGDDPIAHL